MSGFSLKLISGRISMTLPVKLRYLIALAFAASILSVILFRTQLTEIAIKDSLNDTGLENIVVDISQLSMKQTLLNELGFSINTADSILHVDMQGIAIGYDTSSLADKKIHHLLIEKVSIDKTITDSTRQQDGETEIRPEKIIESYQHIFDEYLLFDSITVKQITYEDDSSDAFIGKALSLIITVEQGELHSQIDIFESPPASQADVLQQTAKIHMGRSAITTELQVNSDPVSTAAMLQASLRENVISGTYNIEPSRLRDWIAPIAAIDIPGNPQPINGTISLQFTTDDSIYTTVTATTPVLKVEEVEIDRPEIKLLISMDDTFPTRDFRIREQSYFSTAGIHTESYQLADTILNLSGNAADTKHGWSIDGVITSVKLAATYDSKTLTLSDIDVEIEVSEDKSDVRGHFSPAYLPGKFEFTVNTDFNTGEGKLAIKPIVPIELLAENDRLSTLLHPWPYPFDLVTGSINLAADASWSSGQDFALVTDIEVENAGGNVSEVLFSGLTHAHSLLITPELKSMHAARLTLAHVDSGVTASNISAVIGLLPVPEGSQPRIAVRELYGEIFDGTFSSDDFIFDLNHKTNNITIKASDIDLAKIVDTQQLHDIQVTGRVDGSIPIAIGEQGITVKDGSLINGIRAGTIRYNPEAGAEQLEHNPLTGIALDALKDFRYSQLQAGVNYDTDGNLRIDLHMQGTSPELDTTRPVNLNINTEQNLTALLKSLRFAEGVSSRIDNKVRRLYENKTDKP